MSTTELCRVLLALGFQGDVEGFVQTCDEDEVKELLYDLASGSERKFDMSDLSGESEPVSLELFLRENDECPPDDAELLALVSCNIGDDVRLGIGGGIVTVKRVA